MQGEAWAARGEEGKTVAIPARRWVAGLRFRERGGPSGSPRGGQVARRRSRRRGGERQAAASAAEEGMSMEAARDLGGDGEGGETRWWRGSGDRRGDNRPG